MAMVSFRCCSAEPARLFPLRGVAKWRRMKSLIVCLQKLREFNDAVGVYVIGAKRLQFCPCGRHVGRIPKSYFLPKAMSILNGGRQFFLVVRRQRILAVPILILFEIGAEQRHSAKLVLAVGLIEFAVEPKVGGIGGELRRTGAVSCNKQAEFCH